MSAPVRSCAAALIWRGPGLLALRQSYGPGFWGVPGGVVDAGETPLQAAVREAREEVGLDIRLSGVVGVYTLHGGGWPEVCAYVFQGEVTGPATLRPDPAEIAHAEWLTPAELLTRSPLLPDVRAALQDVLAGRSSCLRRVERELKLPPLEG